MQPNAHPMLLPGVQVVDRGLDRVQVGLAEGRSVVLPHDEHTRAALSVLSGDWSTDWAADAAPPPVRDLVDELARAGLVTDPDESLARRTRRADAQIRVEGDLGVPVLPMLAEMGVPSDDAVPRSGAAPGVGPGSSRPDAVLLLGVGELDRDRLDPWVRRQVPHLPVRALDGEVTLGPFVVPGRTACLSCIDAHRSDQDPEYGAVVERYVRACAGGDPSWVDPMLATVATAWAVRDLTSWLDGGHPSSWSATLTFGSALGEVTSVSWLRHPECGCSWPDPSGTMEE